MKARTRDDRVLGRVHEVGAVAAVNVHVDESRHDDAVERIAAGGRMHGVAQHR